MNIFELFPPYLYCMQYGDGGAQDEYHRLMDEWTDADWLSGFFEVNISRMDVEFWGNVADPEVAAERVSREAYELDDYIEKLNWNTAHGQLPDFDSYFKPLDGEFVYIWELTPVKAYGTRYPSLLRLYAIKLDKNCYLITGGGIKLCRTMQESPDLQKELVKIKQVRSFLREQGIENQEDID